MSFVYNIGAANVNEWAKAGATIRAILVTADYADVANRDDDFVSQLNATRNPALGATAELVASAGYTGGFSGSGRQLVANIAIVEDDANDRAVLEADHHLWPLVTTAQQIKGLVVYVPKTADTDSYLVAFFNGSPFPTPVGGITAQDVLMKWAEGDATRGRVIALPTS